jgi:hypothetical protein
MSGAERSEIDAIEAEIAAEFEEAVGLAKNSREVTPEEFKQFAAAY